MEMQKELLEKLDTFPSPGKHICDCFDKQDKTYAMRIPQSINFKHYFLVDAIVKKIYGVKINTSTIYIYIK